MTITCDRCAHTAPKFTVKIHVFKPEVADWTSQPQPKQRQLVIEMVCPKCGANTQLGDVTACL